MMTNKKYRLLDLIGAGPLKLTDLVITGRTQTLYFQIGDEFGFCEIRPPRQKPKPRRIRP